MTRLVILFAVSLVLAALSGPVFAQWGEGPGLGDRPPPPRGGERDRRPPPPPPVLLALDLDDDGELSADEIAKAVESLKKADKNGDGKLSGDELHPPRPPMGRGGPPGRPPRGRPPGPDPSAGGPPPRGEKGDRPPPRRAEGRPGRESI